MIILHKFNSTYLSFFFVITIFFKEFSATFMSLTSFIAQKNEIKYNNYMHQDEICILYDIETIYEAVTV